MVPGRAAAALRYWPRFTRGRDLRPRSQVSGQVPEGHLLPRLDLRHHVRDVSHPVRRLLHRRARRICGQLADAHDRRRDQPVRRRDVFHRGRTWRPKRPAPRDLRRRRKHRPGQGRERSLSRPQTPPQPRGIAQAQCRRRRGQGVEVSWPQGSPHSLGGPHRHRTSTRRRVAVQGSGRERSPGCTDRALCPRPPRRRQPAGQTYCRTQQPKLGHVDPGATGRIAARLPTSIHSHGQTLRSHRGICREDSRPGLSRPDGLAQPGVVHPARLPRVTQRRSQNAGVDVPEHRPDQAQLEQRSA